MDSMMRKLWTRSLQAVPTISLASVAGAHPGHGPAGSSFDAAHYLTEPLHALGVVGLLVALVAGGWLLDRRRRLRAR